METKVRKQIVLPKGASADIQKVFGVDNVAVWRALNYKDEGSAQGRMLRAAALQRRGVLVDADKAYRLTDHTFETNRKTGDCTFTFSENLKLVWIAADEIMVWHTPNDTLEYGGVVTMSDICSFLMAAEEAHESMIKC